MATISKIKDSKGTVHDIVDTKNTAGATNTTETIYLIGAQQVSDNPQTYVHENVYIEQDDDGNDILYVNGNAVVNNSETTGTGNAITSISVSDGKVTAVKGATYLTSSSISGKANLDSPTFTGTPKAPTAASGTNTTQIATTAFVQGEIDSKIAAADAMIYKGTIGTTGTITDLPSTTAKTGWTYKVITAGKYADQQCEVGDMIICLTDGSTTTAATWTVVQENINGAVTGPDSATDGHIATFNGTTGKVIKDSGYTIATSVPSGAVFTDTKNTAGSTDTSSKIFLVGATSQAANPQTYSQDTAYVGTDGCLYSGGSKVLTSYTDTKNTAGSTDTSNKIFLIGATSQAANPQTYSDDEVYATSGVLTTKSVQVGGTSATMQYNSTNKCIEFVFS